MIFSPLSAVVEDLFNYVHPVTNKPSPKISKETYDIIMKHADVSKSENFIMLWLYVYICTFSFLASQLSHYL